MLVQLPCAKGGSSTSIKWLVHFVIISVSDSLADHLNGSAVPPNVGTIQQITRMSGGLVLSYLQSFPMAV